MILFMCMLFYSIHVYSENAKLQRQKTDHLVVWAGVKECLQTSVREHLGSVIDVDYGNTVY